jgi:TolA-binding protein
MSRAEFDQARGAYERVIRSTTGAKTETAAMAQWMIGETFFMEEKYNSAIKAYLRVEALYSYPRWQAAALLQAGKCHEMIGQWTEAVALYSQIVNDYAATTIAAKADQRLQVARQRAEIVRTR